MVSTDADALVRLAFSGANPAKIARLISNGAMAACAALERDTGTGPETRRRLEVPADARRAQMDRGGIRFLPRSDPGFPAWLRQVPDAPHWLFVTGVLPEAPGVAVVGSRRATRYGVDVAERIGRVLGGSGATVVSGMALGVDGAAHRGCLEVGGHTVAVLGSGIDVWYPRAHRPLGRQILDRGGAIVSEYPPGTTPEPWRFPLRNRIVSGLSRAVVVAEAAERSGALITARLALDQNLDVFAVPGDIDRPTSVGSNLLIRDGAWPMTSISEMMEILGFVAADGGSVNEADVVTIPLDEMIERLGAGDPASGAAALGRMEMEGAVTIRDGSVTVIPRTSDEAT